MLDDFQIIAHELGDRTVKVYAVADVHLGSQECDLDAFRAFLRRVQDDADAFIVICGDLFDNAVTGSPGGIYDAVLPPQSAIDLAVELLAPIKGRILGVVGGNHEERTKRLTDTDPLYTTCCLLGIGHLYRRNAAFVRVRLGKSGTRLQDAYTMMLVHGKSEAKLKKMEYAIEGVDAIISGHTHGGAARKPARLCVTHRGNVVVRPLVSIVATSWLSYGGYGLRDLYLPQAVSDPQCLVLEYAGTNTRRGEMRVSW